VVSSMTGQNVKRLRHTDGWTGSKAHSSYKVQNSDFTWRNLEKLTILLSKPLILSVSSAATVLSNISVKNCVNYELREVTLNMCF